MAENQVKVTSTDTVPNYLYPKIQAGNGIAIRNNGSSIRIDAIDTNVVGTIQNVIQAGDRVTVTNTSNYVVVSADVQTGDHKVMASSADTSPNYLDSKILQGSGITLNTASNYIEISADTQTGDHKVIVDSNDTNPQYLGLKLKSGAGVNISYYNHDKMEIASLGQVKVALLGTMDYLGNKILQGSGITLTKTDNDITIAANTQTGDHKVLATSDDATSAGALADKLYVFSPLVQSTATAGGVKRVTFKIGAGTAGQVLTSVSDGLGNVSASWASPAVQTGDHKVVVDGNDTSPGYLGSKLVQGTGITLTSGANDITVAFDNPMTTSGDIIVGGASGALTRLAKGYQGQVLKVGTNGLEWGTDVGFVNPMEEQGDLIVGTYDGVASRLPIGTANQFLLSNGTTAEWATLPLNIDWFVNPGLTNGDFNQVIDRTFYVRMYPSMQMRAIANVAMILSGAVAADVIRVAVYDNARTMVAYGESTGSSSTFRRVNLTQLQPWTPGTNDLYYLGVSIHASSNSSTKIKTATVTSPSYCWYEDVALTSGRAMPAPSSLTASSSKVPIIGLRGR